MDSEICLTSHVLKEIGLWVMRNCMCLFAPMRHAFVIGTCFNWEIRSSYVLTGACWDTFIFIMAISDDNFENNTHARSGVHLDYAPEDTLKSFILEKRLASHSSSEPSLEQTDFNSHNMRPAKSLKFYKTAQSTRQPPKVSFTRKALN